MVTKVVLEESLGLWLLANAKKIKAERCRLRTVLKTPIVNKPLVSHHSVLPYKNPELPFLGRALNDESKAMIAAWKNAQKSFN